MTTGTAHSNKRAPAGKAGARSQSKAKPGKHNGSRGKTEAPEGVFTSVEITRLEKVKRYNRDTIQLSKTIRPNGSGGVKSDGSPCKMVRGKATRQPLKNFDELDRLFAQFGMQHAIALGRLRGDLPAGVLDIVTKENHKGDKPNVIARTDEFIVYEAGKEALVLLDYDSGGIPDKLRQRIEKIWLQAAYAEVLPALKDAYRLVRSSTSAELYNAETVEPIPGSPNTHTYLAILDGSDAERFLKTLFKRCWLAGYAWIKVSDAGSALQRTLIDAMVFSPSRIVFEGPPVVEPPLAQGKRPAVVSGHVIIDSRVVCPDLSGDEEAEYKRRVAEAEKEKGPELKKQRKVYVDREATKLAKARKISEPEARIIVERRCSCVLAASDTLPWDDPKLAGATVGDILRDPAKYEGMTMADPLEGVSYGRNKAKVLLRRDDGWPMIHSWAHGETNYWLCWDYVAIADAIGAVEDEKVIGELRRHLDDPKRVEISAAERTALYEIAATRTGKTVAEVEQRVDKKAATYTLVCAADVVPRAKEWIWEGHLARKTLEIMAGIPGVGKSQVQCLYTARVTTGSAWPDGSANRLGPMDVIMLTAEDALDEDVIPRLIAAKADLNRIKILKTIKKEKKTERMFLLGEDIEVLEQGINDDGGVGLVTIDPITAYMGKANNDQVTEVRNLLGPLKALAERMRIAVSCVTHPSKAPSQRAIDHFIGSQAYIALPRIGHLCVPEVDSDGKPTGRVLILTQSTLQVLVMPTLAYRILPATIGQDEMTGDSIVVPYVEFDKGTVSISADEAVAVGQGGGRVGQLKEVRQFLRHFLADGKPVNKKDIEEAAKAHGFSVQQLDRAKVKDASIIVKRVGGIGEKGYWMWELVL